MSNYLFKRLCCCPPEDPDELQTCCFENGDCDDLTVLECAALGGQPLNSVSCQDEAACVIPDMDFECGAVWQEAGCAGSIFVEFYGVSLTEAGFDCTADGSVVWDFLGPFDAANAVGCGGIFCAIVMSQPDVHTVVGESSCGELVVVRDLAFPVAAYCCGGGGETGCKEYIVQAT